MAYGLTAHLVVHIAALLRASSQYIVRLLLNAKFPLMVHKVRIVYVCQPIKLSFDYSVFACSPRGERRKKIRTASCEQLEHCCSGRRGVLISFMRVSRRNRHR